MARNLSGAEIKQALDAEGLLQGRILQWKLAPGGSNWLQADTPTVRYDLYARSDGVIKVYWHEKSGSPAVQIEGRTVEELLQAADDHAAARSPSWALGQLGLGRPAKKNTTKTGVQGAAQVARVHWAATGDPVHVSSVPGTVSAWGGKLQPFTDHTFIVPATRYDRVAGPTPCLRLVAIREYDPPLETRRFQSIGQVREVSPSEALGLLGSPEAEGKAKENSGRAGQRLWGYWTQVAAAAYPGGGTYGALGNPVQSSTARSNPPPTEADLAKLLSGRFINWQKVTDVDLYRWGVADFKHLRGIVWQAKTPGAWFYIKFLGDPFMFYSAPETTPPSQRPGGGPTKTVPGLTFAEQVDNADRLAMELNTPSWSIGQLGRARSNSTGARSTKHGARSAEHKAKSKVHEAKSTSTARRNPSPKPAGSARALTPVRSNPNVPLSTLLSSLFADSTYKSGELTWQRKNVGVLEMETVRSTGDILQNNQVRYWIKKGHSPAGQYVVIREVGKSQEPSWSVTILQPSPGYFSTATVEEAFALAEADFSQRFLSELLGALGSPKPKSRPKSKSTSQEPGVNLTDDVGRKFYSGELIWKVGGTHSWETVGSTGNLLWKNDEAYQVNRIHGGRYTLIFACPSIGGQLSLLSPPGGVATSDEATRLAEEDFARRHMSELLATVGKPKSKLKSKSKSKPKPKSKSSQENPMSHRPAMRIVWNAATMARLNPRTPGGSEVYDPRLEQVRAQRQGIYESLVRKALGLPSATPFRDSKGQRIDLRLPPATITGLSSRTFAIGTSIPQRYGRLKAGTQQFTEQAAYESAARVMDPDHLLRNRQDYEETLALPRKGGFYRTTMEPVSWTESGFAWFVWPLPPGATTPQHFLDERQAQAVARSLSATFDPRKTGVWWTPPRTRYVPSTLSHWLPPAEVLHPAYDLGRRAELRQEVKAARPTRKPARQRRKA